MYCAHEQQQLGIYFLVFFVKAYPAYRYYQLFDLFVQPADKDGISMAFLPAMCLRMPCVVFNRNMSYPVISHVCNGLVVPVGDLLQLGDVLLNILLDITLRYRLSDVAYAILRKDFSETQMLFQ